MDNFTKQRELNRCYIVAEMSGNHGGDLMRARQIICAAKNAGADAIKLQTYTADTITLDCENKDFLIPQNNPWAGRKTLHELYQRAYTPWSWHAELFEYAREIGIDIFSSPFDRTAVDLLEELDCPIYKIASPEITDIPLIEFIAQKKKPMVLSAGVAGKEDITLAVDAIRNKGNQDITLCQCTSSYPTPYLEMNLAAIQTISSDFQCRPGLSDHSPGSLAPVVSVTLGAKFIEKHFKISTASETEDSFFSLDEGEFSQMVTDVRNAEDALGQAEFSLTALKSESRWGCRSLYVSRSIAEGEEFSQENIRSVRPGLSLHPRHMPALIGKKSQLAYKKGDRLSERELL